MKDYVMSEELAEKEFNNWAESVGIDVDDFLDDEKNASIFASGKKAVVKALMKGNAVTDGNGTLIYELSKHNPEGVAGEKVSINIPTARVYELASKAQNQNDILFNFISGMTGKDKGWIAKISVIDFKVLSSVAGLFLLD